jgi:transcriptional regulator with XRE-family HTH domain
MRTDQLIKAIMERRGWTQEQLAKRLGTTQSIVSRWLAGAEPRGPKRDRLRDLADESGIIVERPRSERRSVRVMGRIGAGAHIEPDYEQVPPDGLYEVELPFITDEDMIGFQVTGQSQSPFYNDGDVIVVHTEPRITLQSLMASGERAAVCTVDGKRYIKQIVPGSRRGLHTLVSPNGEPIIDVRIRWVSAVVAHVPGRQTRKR